MDDEKMEACCESTNDGNNKLANKLGAIGWSLFFIWVGIVMLAGIGSGIGLLGVGVITLAVQLLRKYFNLALEGFWVVLGLIFAIGGLWELFEAQLSLVPILLIIAGIALLITSIKK